MKQRTTRWLFAIFAAVLSMSAFAADIKVLTAGAYKSVAAALATIYEQRSGHKIVLDNGTAGQLAKRIGDGEAFDVAIITPAAIKDLAAAGKVNGDSVTNVAKVGIGVAVKAGATRPDVSTTEAFKKALLAARAVAYIDPAAGGSSGVYLDKLLERMGIAQEIRAKAVLVPGGLVAERLVDGKADLAIHQVSEILAVPGATLVGPLPADIQNYTTYTAAVAANSANAAAARDFVSLLKSADAIGVMKSKGMEAP